MRFFSRIVFICNCCFIIAVVLRLVEMLKRSKGDLNGAIPFQPLESTLVILGYGAIFINVVFVFLSLYWLLVKKWPAVSRWIILFNLFVFPLQVYYFFFSNF